MTDEEQFELLSKATDGKPYVLLIVEGFRGNVMRLGVVGGGGVGSDEVAQVIGHAARAWPGWTPNLEREPGCDCEEYDCAGECCGKGNCSCTPKPGDPHPRGGEPE